MPSPPSPAPDDPILVLFEGAIERLLLYVQLRLSSRLRQEYDAMDVVQETLTSALASRDTFENRDPGSFPRWLCRIADNRMVDLARHGQRNKRRPVGTRLSASVVLERARTSNTGPLTAAQRAERDGRLATAIQALDDDARSAVLARHFEGRTLEEIAERLGKSPTAVRRLLGRATASLGQALGDESR